ncbi:conserved hypothetical protein [Leishmania major strain Friedlin]|uniref:Uncharacterized protein n=1 Tax=Leishmania major TaxID=5664 RepID=Q4QFA5_LEIMA|nr:conserved hypothetical protein [Leishmania major strain Friedlin]CAG9571448.1 hypothetical_protein_-_conserved [Leishmania major strain Friedlin]CAJ03304.1 conserved hypothetical protein [Leishmania major strain Friedlin]|eukprot:XP_001681993.1 conserved hypothetical protein [Leishmania major strain Friedlin]
MSSGHYSSSKTCSDGSGTPASGSSTLPPTPPLPPSSSSLPQLTSAELAELPPVPMSSSSSCPTPSPSPAASESQHGSVGVDRAGNQESSKSDLSSPYWEEAEEELDNDIEHHSGNGGSESDGTTARGASGEPVDAPLMVPDWLPDPPSSSLASVSASQRTGQEGVQQRAASTIPDSEHSSQGENVPVDTAVLHGCADGADSSTAAFSDADEPGVVRDYREAVVRDAAVTENYNEEEWRQGGREEADDVSDATVAARAASITSDVVAESVWASEERASAALQQFSTSLHSKLVERLIDDAVVAVERTLQDTVRQHESRVRALMAQNRLLDRQLAGQTVQMQSIRKDLEDSILRDLQRVLRVDLRKAFRSASTDRSNGKELSAESTTLPSPSLGCRPSSDAHSPSAEDDVADSIRMQRRSSEGSVPSTYGVDDSAQPSVEELFAAYVNQRGTLELLQKERAQWWESTAVLRDRLFAATREVVQLRQEVERLQTTTVDVAEHYAVVQARGEAEHQCALMRLQLTKHIEEAEMMEGLVERRELAQSRPPDAAESNAGQAASTGAVTATATAAAAAAAAMNKELLRKGPQWDIALRELEEQATIAANSHQLREQLAKAEEELRSLQKDRDASVAYAAELKKEGDVLRADLQSMVYRNSVLSQQVASLLVKVENTCRANRQLQAMQAASPPLQQQQGPLDQLGARKAKRSVCAPTSSRSSSSTCPVPSNELLSTLPSQAERRSAWLSVMWPLSTSGGSDAAAENRLNTAVLYDRQKHRQPPLSPLASADASKMSSPTEVEEGVQQRLNTYAASRLVAPQLDSGASLQPPRRPRHVTLRQLGSATLEVDRVCSPHLPASDQLSGYALGRPSTFSTVDVARGTVTRQVGSEEVTVLPTGAAASSAHGSPSPAAPDDSRAGDVDVWTSAAAASPSTRRVHNTDDVSRDPNLLRLLDTLDKNESLDRFSVNSVAELVLRNQELVKQLYEATQRAEAAERRRQQQGGVSASQLDEKGPSLGVTAASARDPPAPLGSGIDANFNAVPETLTSTTAELLLREGDPNSRKRPRDGDDDDRSQERGDAEGGRHVSGGQGENKASHQQVTDGAGADSAAAVVAVTESWFTKDASDAVASMIDAMVRRRDVRLTSADTEVSRALLQALAARRATDSAVQQARTNGDGVPGTDLTAEISPETDSFSVGVSSRALSSCLHSLAHLCLEQSSALVELARKAEHQNQEMQTAVKNTWTEVQQVLLAALQTSRAALASSTSASDSSAATSAPRLSRQRVRREGGAVDRSCVVGNEGGAQRDGRHEFRPEEQVALLHQLRTLLHTAAKKDETLLRVYQAAQARKDARQHQEKERVARLLLKLERKRRIIKALQHRHANMSVVAAVGADPSARGLSHPSPLDCENLQGTVAAGFRLSPQPGSPARRTPPMPPMVLPAASTTDADDERRGDDDCNRASSVDSGSSHPHRSYRDQHGRDDDDGDSDDELDDEILTLDIFRELQQQLALSQANHQAAQEELDAEKTKHAALLERMWVLEAARDDAVAVADRLEKRVSEMLTREEYQAAVAELEVAAASLMELNTELSNAKAAHLESQEQAEDLKRQLEAQQREAQRQHLKMEDAMRRREQRLLSEEDRVRQLHEQLKDLKQYAADLEKSIALARREVGDQQELVRLRDSTIEELKAQMLMRDDVQELLCRLYPDHSVLHANAQLVRGLSETTARLQLELAETRQDLAHVREELQQRELTAREAVQDRQAAEVRLQDALARLAVLQEPDDGGDAVQRSLGETVATRGTTHPQTADAASRMAALFNVDEASLTALRQRVRYLNACVEAQAKDIAVLRSAESSWKQREIDLRKQLEVMSADPVSLTARRYGLSACLSFEAQLDEMQARQDALESSRVQLQEEKDAIAVTVQEHAKAAAVAQGAADAAQAVVERTKAQLTSATETCAALSSAIARLESERDEESSKRVDVERRYKQVLSELADTKRGLSAVQESLEATRTQRDHFWKDNNLLISKMEELEKALLQSDAEKRAAREALAQGLSASSASASRRRRGGGDSGAVDRYRGQASLTQDLSLSSLSARPS